MTGLGDASAALSLLPVSTLLLLGGVLLLAYFKIGVVLEVLRRGLGGVLPAPVTALLALGLSGLAMTPLFERCQAAMNQVAATAPVAAHLEAGVAPLREFLLYHAGPREQAAVQELTLRMQTAVPPEKNEKAASQTNTLTLPALLVAFALSELRIAFQIAFLLLLPFLLIDLLSASLLAGLLLPGLSARAVALPFKLLLFVACDGWQVLARGLLYGYGAALGWGSGR